MSVAPRRFLVVTTDGVTLASNPSVKGATSTALAMVGDDTTLAILDSKTALVVARVGAA